MDPNQPQKEGPETEKILQDVTDWFKQQSNLLLASIALLVVGFFGGPVAGSGFFWLIFLAGLILISVWLSQRYPSVLGKEEVVDQWGILIGNAQGKAESIFQQTQQFITETKAPDITMEQQEIAPGVIRGLMGGKRPFLLVRNNTNSNLKPYRMYVNARDYGNNLQIAWYVVHQPGFWQKFIAALLYVPFLNFFILPLYLFRRLTKAGQAGFLDLDLFDQQDLTACVTNAHHCLLQAVERLMSDLNQDPSKIDRKSRGFLGIS